MPQVSVLNTTGKKVGTMDLKDDIFGIVPNMSAVHLVVVNYLANQRQGTQSTKTRSEVSGGGKKPWRQKGTGRARQGSTRAPQWTHGGVALGPKPRSYGFSINKKVRKLAMFSALSDKVANDEFTVVDKIELKEIKTAEMVKVLKALGEAKKTLIVVPESDENIYKSARNIKGVKVSPVNALNVYDLVNCNKVVIAKAAVEKLEEVYA
ncbi:MAG: 50S ribosomal protein L4 [Oscillospiraceae bacterium]|nr:50S ribosomal protein L4 [Candidatus Limimonas coprohippi]MCQ2487841.1 50S ribosomal protein L4 [Clostridia bacterium]